MSTLRRSKPPANILAWFVLGCMFGKSKLLRLFVGCWRRATLLGGGGSSRIGAQKWRQAFFSNLSSTPGYPGKTRGISRRRVWFPCFSRDMPNFLTPTPSCGRPPFHRKKSDRDPPRFITRRLLDFSPLSPVFKQRPDSAPTHAHAMILSICGGQTATTHDALCYSWNLPKSTKCSLCVGSFSVGVDIRSMSCGKVSKIRRFSPLLRATWQKTKPLCTNWVSMVRRWIPTSSLRSHYKINLKYGERWAFHGYLLWMRLLGLLEQQKHSWRVSCRKLVCSSGFRTGF